MKRIVQEIKPMKEFDTYAYTHQVITPEQNVFQMYLNINGTWKFKGLVSESAKNIIQSDDTVKDMNSKYKEQELLASFTGKPVEDSKKTYLFIPCPNAEVSTFIPTYKDEKSD